MTSNKTEADKLPPVPSNAICSASLEATDVKSQAVRDAMAVDNIILWVQKGLDIDKLNLTKFESAIIKQHSQALYALKGYSVVVVNTNTSGDCNADNTEKLVPKVNQPSSAAGNLARDELSLGNTDGNGNASATTTYKTSEDVGEDKLHNYNAWMQVRAKNDMKQAGLTCHQPEINADAMNMNSEQQNGPIMENEVFGEESEDDKHEIQDEIYSYPPTKIRLIDNTCPQIIDQTKETEPGYLTPLPNFSRHVGANPRPPPPLRHWSTFKRCPHLVGANVKSLPPPLFVNTLEGELAISFKPESKPPESDWTQVAAAAAEVDQPEVGQVEASNEEDFYELDKPEEYYRELLSVTLEDAIEWCQVEYWRKYKRIPIIPPESYTAFFAKIVKQTEVENNAKGDVKSVAQLHGLRLLFECYKRGILDTEEQINTTRSLVDFNQVLAKQQGV